VLQDLGDVVDTLAQAALDARLVERVLDADAPRRPSGA
jgi:hypothetical protein